MRFGVREICDVVFKPLTSVDIGNQHFDAMQPVLYLDTAKTSTLEGAATTVYAQGGKGNPRLIGWDGEKTLTFTIEDALMSPVSFAMLSGAGVVKGTAGKASGKDYVDDQTSDQKVYVHQTYDLVVETATEGNSTIYFAKLQKEIRDGVTLIATKEAPIYATILDEAGAQKYMLSAVGQNEIKYTDDQVTPKVETRTQVKFTNRGVMTVSSTADLYFILASQTNEYEQQSSVIPKAGDTVRIDCYAVYGEGAQELQITADTFAGYYYIEASTLFRDEATGRDLPAEFVIPRGKIQSNFTFTMAASGDPSTFTFTIDAFPAYTKFNKAKKVMAVLQIIDPSAAHHNYANKDIIGHGDGTGASATDRTADDDDYYLGLYSPKSGTTDTAATGNLESGSAVALDEQKRMSIYNETSGSKKA